MMRLKFAVLMLVFSASLASAQPPKDKGVAAPPPPVKSEANKSGDQSYRPTLQSPLPVRIIQGADEAEDAKTHETKSDNHDAEDLKAQQKAADAAEKQILPSWLGAILSFLGTVLIVWSLCESRQANRIARAALEQSERFTRTELRAYVYGTGLQTQQVIGNRMTAAGGVNVVEGYEIWLPFENFGATPAHNLRMLVTVLTHPMNEEHDFLPVVWDWHNSLIVGPGEKRHTGRVLVPINDVIGSWRREYEIAVRIHFEYTDVLEPEIVRITHYELRLEPRVQPDVIQPNGESVLLVLPFGHNNRAT
jgi:hypothetical protein